MKKLSKRMYKFGWALCLLIVCHCVSAQHDSSPAGEQKIFDTIKTAATEQAALLYPQIRQFSITHQENGVGKIHSVQDGKDLFEGDFRSSRTEINFNMPVLHRNNHLLVASLGVSHQFYALTDVQNFGDQNSVVDHETYIPMMSSGITYRKTQSLWGKPVSFSATARGIFDPSLSRSQFTLMGMATMPLIQTENSRLTGGAVLLLDPASPLPFFLMVNYFHKFRKWDVDLMLDLPYRVALRKEIYPKTSLTFLNELGGSNSFFEFDKSVSLLPSDELVLSSLEIKSGFMAEYRLSKKAVISLSAGANFMINSRIRETNSKPSDYFIENKHDPVPYVQVGFSLLPFWNGLNL